MNKQTFFRPKRWGIYSWLFIVFLGGCEEFAADKQYERLRPATKKIYEIETLKLESAPEEQGKQIRPTGDSNQTAPASVELTLEACRTSALANNLKLKVELIEPSIAEQVAREKEAVFEWSLFSNASYSKSDTPTSTDLEGSKVDYWSSNMGLHIPLRTGGTITFNAADSRVKTNNTFTTLNPAYESDFAASISQPLLRNAGTRANTYQIHIARYDKQIVSARTKLEVIRVIADVDRVYWRLYAARKELEVRQQQYELAMAQLEQARRFVDSGQVPQVEIIRAEAGVAERLEGIIVAENNLRDRQRELKRILNRPDLEMETQTILLPATEPKPIRYQLGHDKLLAKAMDKRIELLELELEIIKDTMTVDFYRNQALPLITLDYAYNINGLGSTRSKSFDMLYDKRFEDHRLGIGMVIPLGNEQAKGRLCQAVYQRAQQLAQQTNRKSLIEIEVLNAIDQLEANWQRILASRQTSILARRVYEAEKRQFELGLRTSTDVLDAQTKFADAQSAEIKALAEYEIAVVDLAYATGTILGTTNVRWDPILPEACPNQGGNQTG